MERTESDVVTGVEELDNEYSNEESTKSPIQEVEEEPFVKVEIRSGLEQLKEAMKTNELKDIRTCFINLTKSYPTAVYFIENLKIYSNYLL